MADQMDRAMISRVKEDYPGYTVVAYVNTTAENNSLTTADNIIRRSNLEGHKITLTIRGCVTDILGARAELDDGVFGKISGLTVSKITYSLSGSGEYTTVVLGDREES